MRSLTATEFARAADALGQQCPALARIRQAFGLPEPTRRPANLDSLVLIILEQQISVQAARTIHRRLRGELGRISARALLGAGETGLRSLGLTRQKAHYCVELGRAVRERRFSLTRIARADDATAWAELVALKGIGPWSAAIYLMMSLGRADIWPPGDLALDRTVALLLPGTDDPADTALRWAPHRSVAAEYLWHFYRNTDSLKTLTDEQRPD